MTHRNLKEMLCSIIASFALGSFAAPLTMDDIKNLIVKVSHTNDVMCDSTSYCADGTHCCYYSSGATAGCCTDGYTCDVDAGTCDLSKKNSNAASVPMVKKMSTKLEDVMCDSTSYCADGTHCCFYSSGAPAGCCTDGYTCDVDAGTCDLFGTKTPMKIA